MPFIRKSGQVMFAPAKTACIKSCWIVLRQGNVLVGTQGAETAAQSVCKEHARGVDSLE